MTKNLTLEQKDVLQGLRNLSVALKQCVDIETNTRATLQDTILNGLRNKLAAPLSIAEAAGVPRNYVDQLRSRSGLPKVVRTDRCNYPQPQSGDYLDDVREAAENYRVAVQEVKDVRRKRDEAMTAVYNSRMVGPGRIADAIGVDRNHVHRVRAQVMFDAEAALTGSE